MSNYTGQTKKYRVKKDIPFQFLQMELKEGTILVYGKRAYYTDAKNPSKIKCDVVSRWPEYFEPVIEDDGTP